MRTFSLDERIKYYWNEGFGGSTVSTVAMREQPTRTNSKERSEEFGRFHIDAHQTDDEVVVIADTPGVSKNDLVVGIDQKTTDLVLGKGGTGRYRVILPWDSVEVTEAWFNNGVLEIRLQPDQPQYNH
jgi:HSP20 family molecular chaperone IbpA